VAAAIDSVTAAIETLRLQLSGAVAALLTGPAFANKGTEHLSRPPKLDAYVEYAAGNDLFLAARYEEALPHFLPAAALDTTFVWPLIHAQAAFINLRRYDRADSLVRAVLPWRERLSRWDQSFLDLNRTWLEGNRTEHFRLNVKLQAEFPGALPSYQLGLASYRVNRPALAIQSLEQTTAGKGGMDGWVGYWDVYTNARHMLRQHRRELRAARKAMNQYPDLLAALDMEAQALAARGVTAAVMQNLDLAAKLSPARGYSAGENMRNAGIEFAAHGDSLAARAAFELAIAWRLSRPPDVQQTPGSRRELAWLYLLT
jgi:tetratricopeptide (TPR) repeat protein